MNIVGTPYKLVHLYFDTASIAFMALKVCDTKTLVAPLTMPPTIPTLPKQ
jgi:hypothetical protein